MAKRSAFTLVELLITASILTLLAAMISVYLGGGQRNARDARRLSDISLIARMIDASTAQRRGAFPAYNSTTYVACPDELPVTANQMDTNIFPNHQVPKDPKPSTTRVSGQRCSSPGQGYLYTIQVPASAITGGQTPTIANTLGRGYVLQVGLENPLPMDESQFVRDTAVTQQPAGRVVYRILGPVP